MHTCSRAPMIGRRMGWGDHDRSDHRHTKLAERDAWRADIAAELTIEVITTHAITPDEFEGWIYLAGDDHALFGGADDRDLFARCGTIEPDFWDEYDPFEDDHPLTYDEIDDEGTPIEGREALDTDDLPGWGTHLDYGDLVGFTITNRPYGYTRGRQED